MQDQDQLTEDQQPAKTYPTTPDAEGFYYENEGEELLEIATKMYDNDCYVKRVVLKKGKVAMVREITGKELLEAKQPAGKSIELVEPAIAAYSTKIDDVQLLMPQLLDMKAKDYSRIIHASNQLNFL